MTFPAKKNTAYSFPMSLISQSNTQSFQLNPTLAAGDIKVKIDGGSYANIGTLPTPTSGQPDFEVALTSSEMNGDLIKIWFKDAAGAEWCESVISIQTTTTPIEDIYTAVDDITTGSTTVSADITAIDGSSSAATIMQYMALATTTALVVSDAGNTASTFKTDLSETTDDFYGNSSGGCVCLFVDNEISQARRISDYDGTTKFLIVSHPFTSTPVNGSRFIITGRIDIS